MKTNFYELYSNTFRAVEYPSRTTRELQTIFQEENRIFNFQDDLAKNVKNQKNTQLSNAQFFTSHLRFLTCQVFNHINNKFRIGQIPKKRNRFTIPLLFPKKRNRFTIPIFLVKKEPIHDSPPGTVFGLFLTDVCFELHGDTLLPRHPKSYPEMMACRKQRVLLSDPSRWTIKWL